MTKISIVIPVYNTDRYLRECVESVLASDYGNFEVILVDDGSADLSGLLCDGFAYRNKNIRICHQKNAGPAAARREGIALSMSPLVMFVDADDTIDPSMLRLLQKEMELSNADIVCCGYEDFYPDGRAIEAGPDAEISKDLISYGECIYEIHGTRRLLCGPVCKLFRRELFEGIDWHEDVTIGEDYAMCLQLFRKAKKVRLVGEFPYHRRMAGKNISRSGYTERHKKALKNYIRIRNGLIKEFPEMNTEIIGFHIEYEMAVITAMCRNKCYDRVVLKNLRDDIRGNIGMFLKKCESLRVYKLSAALIAVSPALFIAFFRPYHLLTGR